MRKITVLEHITLDGIIQAPGSPDEDTSGGFAYGGWITSFKDDILSGLLRKKMNMPFDLLLGRKTFEIWEPYWPQHVDTWPQANAATKYVATTSTSIHNWQPTVLINGNIVNKVTEIKQQEGLDLHIWGSSNLIQTLIQADLIDEFWLMIYPITLGSGKRLFADGTLPMAFKVTEGTVTPSGVIVVKYERAGSVITGNM